VVLESKPKPAVAQDKVAFFAALCLFLSTVEYAIPKPVPIMRLGLANLPVMLALSILDGKSYFTLITLKVITQGLVSGTLFSYVFLFSAAGSFASGTVMFLLHRSLRGPIAPSLVGLSVAGALGNNLVQLVLGRFVLFGTGTRYIAPLLLSTGTVTGVALGLFASHFTAKSQWYQGITKAKNSGVIFQKEILVPVTDKRRASFLFLLAIPVFLLIRDVRVLAAIVFAAAIGVRAIKGRVRLLPAISVAAGVIFFALLVPSGKVLFTLGSLAVTEGALAAGLGRAEILVGMVFLSQLILGIGPPLNQGFLAKVFTYYGCITAKKIPFKKGHVIQALDEHLLSL
jgi:heptaprenyl diphosphate synthase